MMKSTASQVMRALVLVYVCNGVNSLPNNFAIVHGKRSVDLEPNIPETQFDERAPFKIISSYLDPEYEIVEDESPFRRNEPEVPTKVAHMFGRTLDDQDLSRAILDSLRINSAQAISWPYIEEPMTQERIIDAPRIVRPRYPQQIFSRNQHKSSSYNRGSDNKLYRYLAAIINPSNLFEDDSDDVIGTV